MSECELHDPELEQAGMATEIYLWDSYGGPEGQNIAAFHK